MGSFHLILMLLTLALIYSCPATAQTTINHAPGIGGGEEPSYIPDSSSTTTTSSPSQAQENAAATVAVASTWSTPTDWQATNWLGATVVPDEPPYQTLAAAEPEESWSLDSGSVAGRLGSSSTSSAVSTGTTTESPTLTSSQTAIMTSTSTSDPSAGLVTNDDRVPGTASVVSAVAAASSSASSAEAAAAASSSVSVSDDSGSAAVGRNVGMRELWMVVGGITGVVAWMV